MLLESIKRFNTALLATSMLLRRADEDYFKEIFYCNLSIILGIGQDFLLVG